MFSWFKRKSQIRDTQEIFNVVIRNGLYRGSMESSLHIAYVFKYIKAEEYKLAYEEVRDYLNTSDSRILKIALMDKGLPSNHEDCIHIFLDWDNKPNIAKYSL